MHLGTFWHLSFLYFCDYIFWELLQKSLLAFLQYIFFCLYILGIVVKITFLYCVNVNHVIQLH